MIISFENLIFKKTIFFGGSVYIKCAGFKHSRLVETVSSLTSSVIIPCVLIRFPGFLSSLFLFFSPKTLSESSSPVFRTFRITKMENREKVGSPSSFTNDLFGAKESTPVSTGIFSSIFPPPSTVHFLLSCTSLFVLMGFLFLEVVYNVWRRFFDSCFGLRKLPKLKLRKTKGISV